MLTFIFVVIGIIFILGVIITINDGVKAENNKEELYKNISDLPYTKHFVSEDGKRSIMLDDESKDIHLYDANNIKQINYKDILQVEVMEDSKKGQSGSKYNIRWSCSWRCRCDYRRCYSIQKTCK